MADNGKDFSKNLVEGFRKINYNGGVKEKAFLYNALEMADRKAKYDARVKRILSDKNVLAWVLKYTVREFKQCSIDEIWSSIEGAPEVSTVPVYPGKRKPEAIVGMTNSDDVPNEGEVTYDIRFHAIAPGGKRIKLIINIEGQKKYYPGYDLVTRAVFYCARLLSAQLDMEFTGKDYDELKKVYSIWICMDVPKYAANTITEYKMEQTKLYGNFSGRARYDLLSAVMVCLESKGALEKEFSRDGGFHVSEDSAGKERMKLHGLLSALLTEKLTPEQKIHILENDFGIAATTEMKEDMRIMCNLSDLIEERGIEQGMLMTLCSLVNDGVLKPEEAAKRANMSVAAFDEKLKEINTDTV